VPGLHSPLPPLPAAASSAVRVEHPAFVEVRSPQAPHEKHAMQLQTRRFLQEALGSAGAHASWWGAGLCLALHRLPHLPRQLQTRRVGRPPHRVQSWLAGPSRGRSEGGAGWWLLCVYYPGAHTYEWEMVPRRPVACCRLAPVAGRVKKRLDGGGFPALCRSTPLLPREPPATL
jgi:hypothetical protein